VLKSTDRWTPPGDMRRMTEVASSEVPVDIRRKAGQRLGALRSGQRRCTTAI
jgi:hypothetical protein